MDLLAVVLGDKPGPLSVILSNMMAKIGSQRTLSRVPVAIRGIALTTPENMVDLNDGLKVELRCEKSAIIHTGGRVGALIANCGTSQVT